MDTTSLLNVVCIPAEDQVEVVKIQLTDIARTWWLAQDEQLVKSITRKEFSKSFNERFFPKIVRRDGTTIHQSAIRESDDG